MAPTLALVQSPSQASRSRNLKRGLDHHDFEKEEEEEEEDKKDEARTSPSPTKKARLAHEGTNAKVVPILNVGTALSDATPLFDHLTVAHRQNLSERISVSLGLGNPRMRLRLLLIDVPLHPSGM